MSGLDAALRAAPVALWTLDEAPGTVRRDRMGGLSLYEGGGTMPARPGGVWGSHALVVEPGHWLYCPRSALGRLDIHGHPGALSLVAWLWRTHAEPWQFIAGVWDESHSLRQYGLFCHARARSVHPEWVREPCADRLHGHISATGGKTPGREAWVQYATGAGEVPLAAWTCAAVTYDGAAICVWRDGQLDTLAGSNPLPYPDGIFSPGAGGAPFTVGANHVRGGMTNCFGGLLGGLAVYDRALDARELAALAVR